MPRAGGSIRSAKIPVTPVDAARWFLRDMALAAGYTTDPVPGADPVLAGYASYRPLLTAADPWYFAGVLALEACMVVDYYSPEFSNEVMRHIIEQCDKVIGREGTEVADLTQLIMGRLGIGTVLLRGKAPDSVLGKIMYIMMGSAKSVESKMPAPDAHTMLRAALKLGKPIWWRVFRKKYRLSFDPEGDLAEQAKRGPMIEEEAAAAHAARMVVQKKERSPPLPSPAPWPGSSPTTASWCWTRSTWKAPGYTEAHPFLTAAGIG